MPTVLTIGPYRFSFYSRENGEPPHIHVKRGRDRAKFWLAAFVELENSRGFAPHELNELLRLVVEHREAFLGAWNEHFDEVENGDADRA